MWNIFSKPTQGDENMEGHENGATDFGTSELSRNGMTFTVGPKAEEIAAGPWANAATKYPVGTKLHGKVVNFKPYGFFVETEQGFFGLVHGSQIKGWDWHARFDEVFKLGDEVDVEVTKVDPEAHRMAFAYEMPEGKLSAPEPAEPEPQPVTHDDLAREWAKDNPDASSAAHAWLLRELEDGPMYSPLANVLSDKFDVPVPVSFWIRQFPDFTCFIGKGDNPSELPAVALTEKAGDLDYWKRFKAKASDLAAHKTTEAVDAAKFGPVAAKLNALADFPGAGWIAGYGAVAETLSSARETFGVADTVERLVVPLLAQFGWEVSGRKLSPLTLVRGDRGSFDLKLFVGQPGEERLAVAVVCDRVGTAFRELRNRGNDPQQLVGRNVIERVLGYANQQRDFVEGFTKVVWTDGHEWVVFTDGALARRIGILSDRSGERILDETRENDANAHFRRIVLPMSGSTLDWLAAFAELRAWLGQENFAQT